MASEMSENRGKPSVLDDFGEMLGFSAPFHACPGDLGAAIHELILHLKRQAGAIAPLIQLLAHSDRGVQAQAASALGNLAGDSSENHYDKQAGPAISEFMTR